jgi:hypothetical protein
VPPPPAGPAQPPSLVAVFAREVRKRKTLALVWALATVVVTAAVVFLFARPLYRAEGKYVYLPNYRAGGARPIYTPPNIQSAVQILKAPEVLEPVRQRHLPDVSKEQFAKDVRIEVARQSEFIDVGFDHPDAKVATAVASEIMTEGLKHFADERVRVAADGIAQLRKDREKAMRRLQEAKDDYAKTHLDQGVSDPLLEMTNVQVGLADVNRQLRAAHENEAKLKRQIEVLSARQSADSDPTDASMYESLLANLQTQMVAIQSEANIQHTIDEARVKLEEAQKKELQYRRVRGIVPENEYNEVVTQIKLHKATLAEAERTKKEREDIQKRLEELKKQMAGGKPVRKAIVDQLVMLKLDLEGIPATIAALEVELKQRQADLSRMSKLQRELSAKDEEIKVLRLRVQDFDTQVTDATERGQDLYANDLRIHSMAAAGSAPNSTNTPKLALAVIGASAFLFVGYIALFCLPKLAPDQLAGLGASQSPLPRALVALVPFMQRAGVAAAVGDRVPAGTAAAGGDAKSAEPKAAPPDPGVRAPVEARGKSLATESTRSSDEDPVAPKALAERMAEDGVDHGGIVLFTPTAEELQVAPAIGEMGQYFTQRGERVLVFDARAAAETPSWAGPDAPAIASTVEGYLDGRAAAATDCFVPTSLQGIEYSRADLATRVGGVMAAHRFRQLVEEMRERYSVVFLVGPPVTVPDGDPLLATLAEGMVLVTEASASPSEVHAFVETMSHQVPTRLYGTLSVPKA